MFNGTADMTMKSCNAYYRFLLRAAAATLICACISCPARAQLNLPNVPGNLTRIPPDLIDENRVRRTVDDVADPADDAVDKAGEVVDETTETVDELTDDAARQVNEATQKLLRTFVPGTDASGAVIEQEIVVVMIEMSLADSLVHPALDVIARRDLPSLGLAMLTLRRTGNVPLPQAADELRTRYPAATVDLNHVYSLTQASSAAKPDIDGDPVNDIPADAATLRIGIIDSAVQPDHRALAGVTVVGNDLVDHDGLRPETHGTAVASLVAKAADDHVTIYSASVFFQLPNSAPGATAESLVAALDWLVSRDVQVINMSLAGPPNRLLGIAMERLIDSGAIVVAAVGNNGPSSAPLYPAAYDGVVGVTAVDRKHKVFRYANRGDHVDFAAIGVDMKVADSTTGGWRIESGTSMASPHIAVIIARILNTEGIAGESYESWLIADARDLGRKGFDPVYGYGLVTRPPVVVSSN